MQFEWDRGNRLYRRIFIFTFWHVESCSLLVEVGFCHDPPRFWSLPEKYWRINELIGVFYLYLCLCRAISYWTLRIMPTFWRKITEILLSTGLTFLIRLVFEKLKCWELLNYCKARVWLKRIEVLDFHRKILCRVYYYKFICFK